MAFLFGRNRQRTSQELCRSTKDLLRKLEGSQNNQVTARLEDEIARNLSQIKLTLQGTADLPTAPQQVYQLSHLLMSEDLLLPLAKNIHRLQFESRKDCQVIFSTLFRFKSEIPTQQPDPPILSYIVNKRPELIAALCNGYEHREGAMFCGGILREALKHDSICALILYDEPAADGKSKGLHGVDPNIPASGNGVFWKFFGWIDKCAFEVSADAFSTFREILTKHKKLSAHYMLVNFDRFVAVYNTFLILSQSYVTKRQSINLLAQLLLERANYALMTHYVESENNLKLCMNILKDDRRMVSYEGFHIFKVFVANPNKSIAVQRILINNREKLLRFLPPFLEDRKEDMQFEDEKAYLIRMIETMPDRPVMPKQQNPAAGMANGKGGAGGQGALMA